jgi:hypothetical protein
VVGFYCVLCVWVYGSCHGGFFLCVVWHILFVVKIYYKYFLVTG